MPKQKTKIIFAKAIIAVFLINTIFLFNFANPILADANGLNVRTSFEVGTMGDSLRISWDVIDDDGESSNEPFTYEDYYSKLYKSLDFGKTWELIIEKEDLGHKIHDVILNDPGTYLFKIEKRARTLITSNSIINGDFHIREENNNFILISTGSCYATPYLLDYSELTDDSSLQEIILNWYLPRDSRYVGQFAKIYKRTNGISPWKYVVEVSGTGYKSYDIELDRSGISEFKIVKYGVYPGYMGSPPTYVKIGEEISNSVKVSGIKKFALIVCGSRDFSYISIKDFYDFLIDHYDYNEENIQILAAKDPSRIDEYNTLPNVRELRGLRDLHNTIDDMRDDIRYFDDFLLLWSSHGTDDDRLECGDMFLPYKALDANLDLIYCEVMHCIFDSCFSGSIVENYPCFLDNNRFVYTPCDWWETTGKGFMIESFTEAMSFMTCERTIYDVDENEYVILYHESDMNSDGHISMHELWEYIEFDLIRSSTPRKWVGSEVSNWDEWFINDGVYNP